MAYLVGKTSVDIISDEENDRFSTYKPILTGPMSR